METQPVTLVVPRPKIEADDGDAKRADHLSIQVVAMSPDRATHARHALLERLHEQRHELLDLKQMRPLTADEEADFLHLRREIDKWELIEDSERQAPAVRTLAALAEKILGGR